MFFFEKKNQKTFANVVRAAAPDARQRQKVFLLLFFSKKQRLPCVSRRHPMDFNH
jgi:hypothetical protein